MYYFISPSLKGVRSFRSFGRRIRRPGGEGGEIQLGRTGWEVLWARVSIENERRGWLWGRRRGCLVARRSLRCSLDSCDTRRSHASPLNPPPQASALWPLGLEPLLTGCFTLRVRRAASRTGNASRRLGQSGPCLFGALFHWIGWS